MTTSCPFCNHTLACTLIPGWPVRCPCGAYGGIDPEDDTQHFLFSASKALEIDITKKDEEHGYPIFDHPETVLTLIKPRPLGVDSEGDIYVIQWAKRKNSTPESPH